MSSEHWVVQFDQSIVHRWWRYQPMALLLW